VRSTRGTLTEVVGWETPRVDEPARMAYSERLGVPLRWWVQGTMLVASLWLALVVALPRPVAWAVSGCALALLAAMLVAYGSARIEVGVSGFRAGRARIGAEHLGTVTPLDAEETRRAAGRDADARAYLVLRPYVSRAVRVEITDPRDPTPYWLVSSRRPDALAEALTGLAQTGG
jgi:hypothetical protein